MNDYTRKAINQLPVRDLNVASTYDGVLIIPIARKNLDSEHNLMQVVGVNDGVGPVELAGLCDVVKWRLLTGCPVLGALRVECIYPARLMHYWSDYHRLTVAPTQATLTIDLTPKD